MNDMPALYAASDVLVCRAGAGTMAEVLVTGTPAVMVPGTFAEGHQMHNARVAEAAGAAVVVPDAEADADRLEREIDGLLADAPRRLAMSAAGHRLAGERGAAAPRLARLVLDVAA